METLESIEFRAVIIILAAKARQAYHMLEGEDRGILVHVHELGSGVEFLFSWRPADFRPDLRSHYVRNIYHSPLS